MRVLILAALAGCYSPGTADCQFKCGESDSCPADTTCADGFCRTSSSSGTCGSIAGEAGTSPEAGIDGPAAVCPSSSPCGGGIKPVAVGSDDCAVLCTDEKTFSDALSVCGSDDGSVETWHIAILDTAPKRAAFGAQLSHAIGWVGLQRTLTTWHWLNHANETLANNDPAWASGEPMAQNPDGAFDSTSGDELVTDGVSATHQFFCEYRP
jgi:hypothetical protein